MNPTSVPKFQPLYKQMKELIRQQIIDGVWSPGMALPSEQQLGKSFGVSQGTIRKALDEMTTENILIRKQGKGTFVSQHSDNRSLFHFFCLVGNDGSKVVPKSKILSINRTTANRTEVDRLRLDPGDKVMRIKRVRYLGTKPVVCQNISLPVKIFAGLGNKDELPNTLYKLYESDYDVKIVKAVEKLRAVIVKEEHAKLLGIPEGSPVMEADRTAIALDGSHAEWRLSYVNTQSHYYLSELT